MKTIDDLTTDDYIAFEFNYYGGEPNEIIVDKISNIETDKVLVHFLYGHHSLAEYVNKNDIIAIGNLKEGKSKIKGWSGRFDIIKKSKLIDE